MKFYICRHCGNVITKLTSAQVPVKCCGEEMQLLEAGVTDAAQEKHVPAVTVEGSLVKVNVGSVTHPMTAEHFIQWVVVETDRRKLDRELTRGMTKREVESLTKNLEKLLYNIADP